MSFGPAATTRVAEEIGARSRPLGADPGWLTSIPPRTGSLDHELRFRPPHLRFPAGQLRPQLDEDLRALVAQIMPLTDVGLQVEEQLDGAVLDVLPPALAHGLLLAVDAVDPPAE